MKREEIPGKCPLFSCADSGLKTDRNQSFRFFAYGSFVKSKKAIANLLTF